MKILIGITVIVASLAIGLLGINTSSSNSINNAYAQEGFQTQDLVNETIDLGNATTSNATLVFAQEGSITPEEINNTMQIFNDTSMTMNATLPVSLTGNNTAKPMD